MDREMSMNLISPEEALAELDALKAEQKQIEAENEADKGQPRGSNMIRRSRKPNRTSNRNSSHVFSFECICAGCVKKTTITMQDRDFLNSMGILWRSVKKQEEVLDKEEVLDNLK